MQVVIVKHLLKLCDVIAGHQGAQGLSPAVHRAPPSGGQHQEGAAGPDQRQREQASSEGI